MIRYRIYGWLQSFIYWRKQIRAERDIRGLLARNGFTETSPGRHEKSI